MARLSRPQLGSPCYPVSTTASLDEPSCLQFLFQPLLSIIMSSSRRSSRRLNSSAAEPSIHSQRGGLITEHFAASNGAKNGSSSSSSSSSAGPPSSTSPTTSPSGGSTRRSQAAKSKPVKDEETAEEATSTATRGRLRAIKTAQRSSQVSARKRGRSVKREDEEVEGAETADVKPKTEATAADSSEQEAEAAEGDADADDGDAAEEDEEALSYEQQRQANIRRNAEQMRQLQLVALVPTAAFSAARRQKRQAVEGGVSKRGTRQPSRRSLRNQGLAPDGSISEVKEGEGRYVPVLSDWQQRSRREGALDMQDVKVEVRGTYNSSAAGEREEEEEEADVMEEKQAQAAEGTVDAEAEEKKEDATIAALCAAFVSLTASGPARTGRSATAAAAAPFTPARIRSLQHVSMTNKLTHKRCTTMAFHPASSSSRSILVSGDKAGQMGVLVFSDARKLREEAVQQAAFEPHAGAVNSFCFHSLTQRLYSASNDGSIRLFDFDRQQFAEAFVNNGEESLLTVCSSPHHPSAVFTCDRKGDLIVLDTASASLTPVSRTSLSAQKVNCVDVAAGGNMLASCGNDRTVRVWDLRAMRDDSPLHSFTHGYSVNSVYFSPSGSLLLSTCIDDYLRVWPVASADPSSWPDCARIRHNNHTGRWVTLFRARWTMTDDAFIVGNMQRQVDVYGWEAAAAGGWSGGRQAGGVRQPEHSALTSAELTAIPSVIAVHPTNSCFLAATASAYAYVFA